MTVTAYFFRLKAKTPLETVTLDENKTKKLQFRLITREAMAITKICC